GVQRHVAGRRGPVHDALPDVLGNGLRSRVVAGRRLVPQVPAMKALIMTAVLAAATTAAAQDVTSRDVRFFSEGVQCYGRLYLPKGFKADGKAPAVVLAPGWMQTEASIDKFAARFAARGLVAMAIDYRGWGRSGGYVYLAEPIRVDDRQRFSQHTAKVRIRR